MCGIAGYAGVAPPELLPSMLRELKHRGPDDDGLHLEPGIGLGATRPAIIDLHTGHQPIANADESAWIVFNGEIYNFRDLRATLQAKGRTFRTQSDTEVVLKAYEAFGPACVERLRGMFAFALWDRPRRRLLLARDRLGKKPLYYWQRGALFLFASEPKALLCHPAIARTLDWDALHHYLAFGYTPRARSIFAEIAKLPPGHTAVFTEGRLAVARRFETDHHEEILEPVVADLLPTIVHHFDEPFADSSAIPTFVVAQSTARHVKVALSGIGGDETFAGYPRYLGLRLSELYATLPRWLRTLPASVALRLMRESEASRSWRSWVRRFAAGGDQPLPDRYIGWTRFFSDGDLARLATPAVRRRWQGSVDDAQRAAFGGRGHGDPVDGAFRVDLSTYLPDDLLVMADRMSMTPSPELRAPFCDHKSE